MKKRALVSLIIATLLTTSAYAVVTARPGEGVQYSVHDMNVIGDETNMIMGDEQGRVCVFCHTPHHAFDPSSDNDHFPLWAHNLSNATSYHQYASIDAAIRGVGDDLVGPSRICMGCHDGTIAPDIHYGEEAGAIGNRPLASAVYPIGAGYRVGMDTTYALNKDHPIGFSYDDVYDAEMASGFLGIYRITPTTMYLGTRKIIKLFGPTRIMTCTTCHDVHNRDNFTHTLPAASPYLIPLEVPRNYLLYADQNGSKLCLSCHIK